MFSHVHSCVCACMYVHFCNTPPQVLKFALPPPPPNIEKLPTPISQAAILGTPFETQKYLLSFLKARKEAKIRNGYNQVPHLTKDTHRKVIKTQ